MKGPAGVLALVLAETVGGATGYLFLMPLWNEVRRGFFKLCGLIILLLAVGLWASVAAARIPGDHFGELSLWLSLAFTIASALWLILLIIAVVLEAIAVIAGGFGPAKSKEFSALLTAAGLAPWIALGMVGATALIAGMIKATLKGERATAVQAATGFFYLAVITAFA